MNKFKCLVCGYIHIGDIPPQKCPICGVGSEQFIKIEENFENNLALNNQDNKKRWKCTVCDYIFIGDMPIKNCPVCNAGPEFFVPLSNEINVNHELTKELLDKATDKDAFSALDKISYGLYIITSFYETQINGQCSNTIFQLTSTPKIVAACLNKRNLTHDYIKKSGMFAVSLLEHEQINMVHNFGYKSGHNENKFKGIDYIRGINNCPILKHCLAYLECQVIQEKITDVGTHTLFIAEVTNGKVLTEKLALTYSLYKQKKYSV